jgi:hypothetical protein
MHAAFFMTPDRVFMIRYFPDNTYAVNVLSGGPLSDDERSRLIGHMRGWEGPTVNNASLSDKQRFCSK